MNGYKCSVVEYTSNNDGKENVEYLTACVKENEYDTMIDNFWKIINKDFINDNFDILKDIKIVGNQFPIAASVDIAGKKLTTEDLNITDDGKIIVQGLNGDETLVANISSYIKNCTI